MRDLYRFPIGKYKIKEKRNRKRKVLSLRLLVKKVTSLKTVNYRDPI